MANESGVNAIGVKDWVIAEGYIPKESHGPSPQMISHETVCILNCSGQDAHVEITIYYKDREPVGPYRVTVPARRTRHVPAEFIAGRNDVSPAFDAYCRPLVGALPKFERL